MKRIHCLFIFQMLLFILCGSQRIFAQYSVFSDVSAQIQASTSTIGTPVFNNPGYFRNNYSIKLNYGLQGAYAFKRSNWSITAGYNLSKYGIELNLLSEYYNYINLSEADYQSLPKIKFTANFNEWLLGTMYKVIDKEKTKLYLSGGISFLDFKSYKNFVPYQEDLRIYLNDAQATAYFSYYMFDTGFKQVSFQIYSGVNFRKYITDRFFLQFYSRMYFPLAPLISNSFSYSITSDNFPQPIGGERISILKGDRLVMGISAGFDF